MPTCSWMLHQSLIEVVAILQFALVPLGAWPILAVASVVGALQIAMTLVERSEQPPTEMALVVRWLSVALTTTIALAWRTPRRIA